MGTDLITKAANAFVRKQRRCLDLMDEPNLFSGAPQLGVAVVATPINGHTFAEGGEYRLSFLDGHLVVIRGISTVGFIEDPPGSVVDMMRGICPSAFGRVVSVFSLTDKAEILLE